MTAHDKAIVAVAAAIIWAGCALAAYQALGRAS